MSTEFKWNQEPISRGSNRSKQPTQEEIELAEKRKRIEDYELARNYGINIEGLINE